MSRIDTSIEKLFMQIGTTPVSRSVKADTLFRRLRDEQELEIAKSLFSAPTRLDLSGVGDKPDSDD